MLFRQLFDPETSTYTYLLADEQSREAVLIDPVREQADRDLQLLSELGLKLTHVLETHVHADHVTGAGLLRERTGAKTVVSGKAGAPCADWKVAEGDRVRFGPFELEVRETPGHTDGCLTYVTTAAGSAPRMVFTGDALLIRGCGRTDFQQGNAAKLYDSVTRKIFELPSDTLVYPGHDYKGQTVSTVGEERAHNPRLGKGRGKAEFAEIMANLKLAYPKRIHEAVPANLLCGRPEATGSESSAASTSRPTGQVEGSEASGDAAMAVTPAAESPRAQAVASQPSRAWAPVERTAAGIPEVTTAWVEETYRSGHYTLVDVRERYELQSELGAIPGVVNHPLAKVAGALANHDRSLPVVLVCRSGGRSGAAALDLERLGFSRVASMGGGMLAWQGPRAGGA